MRWPRWLWASQVLSVALSSYAQDNAGKDLADYVWDLSFIIPSDSAFDPEVAEVRTRLASISNARAAMGRSSGDLANVMDAAYDLRSRAAKLRIYGSLRSDVDVYDEAAKRMAQVGNETERQVEAALAFLPYELCRLNRDSLDLWLEIEPGLAKHKRRIARVLLEEEHLCTPEVRAVLESMKGWPASSLDGYFALLDSDLPWPKTVSSDGSSKRVDPSTIRTFRRSVNRAERDSATKAYLAFLDLYAPSLAHLYCSRIKADLEIAHFQHFTDAIDALWFLRDGVPEGAYGTMLRTATKNKVVLDRYASMLKARLGATQLRYTDLLAPPPGSEVTFNIHRAFDLALKALAPLGEEFIEKARFEAERPTMHLVPLPNKRGHYSNEQPIAGMPSYSMMSFRGTYGNVRTLTGMLAQKVRFASLPVVASPDTRDDPPIYSNALLYVAEMMLTDYMVSNAGSRQEKLYYLETELHRLWDHGFELVVGAALDATVQRMIMHDSIPSGHSVSATYLDLLRHQYSGIEVDPEFANDWMTDEVKFMSFEGQLWTPAMAVACDVYARMKDGDQAARSAMAQGLLGKCETDLSFDMCGSIGIDLASERTYQATYDRMTELLDRMERLLRE